MSSTILESITYKNALEIFNRIKQNAFTKKRIKSDFFKELMSILKVKNWVDIEHLYYDKLVEIPQLKKDKREVAIKQLNREFKQIQDLLEGYLTTKVEDQFEFETRREFNDIFQATAYNDTQGYLPNKTLILNFNYTQTAKAYTGALIDRRTVFGMGSADSAVLVNIHGELYNKENPIIFGFGDEIDENYLMIENLNDNRFLDFVKTFMYSKTKNYKRVESFVESEEFEVFIIGHSCGLSDRTLLSYIFESENCKRIKLYYYENLNHYIDSIQNISRHFKDNKVMRRKVVSFECSEPCPQVQLKKKVDVASVA